MDLVKMQKITFTDENGNQGSFENKVHRKEQIPATGGDGKAILIPGGGIRNVGVQLIDNSTIQQGKIYLTNASPEDIKNDVAGIWLEYNGIEDINPAITAVYQNNPGGGINTLYVSAQ